MYQVRVVIHPKKGRIKAGDWKKGYETVQEAWDAAKKQADRYDEVEMLVVTIREQWVD